MPLRTATPMGDWRSFKFTVTESAGLVHGELYLVQETAGVVFVGKAKYDADGCKVDPPAYEYGEEAVLIYHAEKIIVDKIAGNGERALPGEKAYWSGVYATGVSPVKQSGWYWIGIFTELALEDDTEAEIDLKGDKATLLE